MLPISGSCSSADMNQDEVKLDIRETLTFTKQFPYQDQESKKAVVARVAAAASKLLSQFLTEEFHTKENISALQKRGMEIFPPLNVTFPAVELVQQFEQRVQDEISKGISLDQKTNSFVWFTTDYCPETKLKNVLESTGISRQMYNGLFPNKSCVKVETHNWDSFVTVEVRFKYS